MSKLVIVESPAKAKTIGKYLGKDYEVTASMGHIRDLPASQLGIDVEHDYTPQYISIKGKEKLIKELKSKAKHSDGVLLATDPDREGEAISWHLANILGLDPHEPNRVTFDEITKKGVQEGMAHPRAIDEDLFNAQQARRVLDRLVGYKLSPFLWRKVRRGLSAGRVQSVAVRLIDDREKEIESFKPEEYWNIDANLKPRQSGCAFNARLTAQADGTKLVVKNKKQADAILAALDGKPYTVTRVDKGQRRRQLSAGALELFHRHPLGVVAGGPFQHPAGVIDFAQDEIARIETALCLAVCDAVLGLPQQDVAPLFAYGPGQKASLRAEKAQIDPEVGAFAHQGRACAGIAEADDAFQRVERDPAHFSLVAEQDDVLPLEGKVGVLVENVERVQKLSHGAASCISSRWARR